MQYRSGILLRAKIPEIVYNFSHVPPVWLSTSVLSTHLSIFSIEKSFVTAFSELHVAKSTVQETKSDNVEAEQGTHLFGYLLLSAELRRHPNYSSIRFPYTCLRHRRCFGTDSRRHVTYCCRISPVVCWSDHWICNFCKVLSNAAQLNDLFEKHNWFYYSARFYYVGNSHF